MGSRPPLSGPRWSRWTLATLVTLGLGSGLAFGALTVAHGSGEIASGQRTGGTGLAWWSVSGIIVTATTPATPPGAVSQTAGSPTVLASSGASYMVNTGVAGDTAVEFQLQESTSAPTTTELELQFSVTVNGGAQTATVYLETQSSAPASALTFNLYFDSGSTTGALNPEQEVSQPCASVGQCP